jgi:hypothetical protein
MKLIPLTQGQFAKVDDEWFDYLMQWKWHAYWNNPTQSFYARRTLRDRNGSRPVLHMHRVIMNTPKDMICDHENHDTLNNQEYNLRNVTYSQNNMNSKTYKNNALGEKCIRLKNGKYQVRIFKGGVCAFFRTVSQLEEAKSIRDIKIKEIHGEFAYLGETQ